MDNQRRTVIMRLLAGFVFVVCLSACEETGSRQLVDLPEITKWAPPNVDAVALLTSEPAICLDIPEQGVARRQILLGRAVFRSPYLLGGQAARRGFSCNACHTNGGVNQHFFVEGMSAEPGTADVTNFHFSKTLGDEQFNPKAIPSLVLLAVPRTATETMAREVFILRLIEKEFDGMSPHTSIKQALIAYVEALNINACQTVQHAGREMLNSRLMFVDESLILLSETKRAETKRAETKSAEAKPGASKVDDFLRMSLRAELGRLHARFPVSKAMQRRLKQLSKMAKEGDSADAISRQWRSARRDIISEYDYSLFAPRYVEQFFPGRLGSS